MLITVTTTSANLKYLAWDISSYITWNDSSHLLKWLSAVIQNLWTTDIYFDFVVPATVSWWIQIAPWWVFSWDTSKIDKINLISDSVDNANIRLSIN